MTKLNALLIDDDKKFCHTFQMLAEATFDLTIVHSGRDGLEALNKLTPHVVLLDLKLGKGMDGIEVLKRIKKSHPDLPVIMITDYADVDTAVEAMKLGALHYMSKSPRIEELKLIIERQLEQVNLRLLYEEATAGQFDQIVAESPVMKAIMQQIEQVAKIDSTILIQGESGTGKEILAREIHRRSHRSHKPFVPINCSNLPASLFESEFFGHEKGAFTSADVQKKGKLELANQGTIFLDEIGDLPMESQAKILRCIEERCFQRLGGTDTIAIDVRIIAASNKNLLQMIKERLFREDLFHRLNVIPISLPPLRERPEDIPKLVDIFLHRYSKEMNKPLPELTPAAMSKLQAHSWPGNIRDLRNFIERLMATYIGAGPIDASDIKFLTGEQAFQFPVYLLDQPYEDAKEALFHDFKKVYFRRALQKHHGNISSAAKECGLNRASLHKILRELEIG
ncbi:MAG: sigma-54 dependent transcriptional regulator [candidate division KSB1 bacterium]|nr:sigma-54 dependent transcriptional regulator [candidate division KSB1 bacterium]